MFLSPADSSKIMFSDRTCTDFDPSAGFVLADCTDGSEAVPESVAAAVAVVAPRHETSADVHPIAVATIVHERTNTNRMTVNFFMDDVLSV